MTSLEVPSILGRRMRTQITENGACFGISEASSAQVAHCSGVQIADSPRIPCAFPSGLPRRETAQWNVDRHSAPFSCPEACSSCSPIKHPGSNEATDLQCTYINILLQECRGLHTGLTRLPLGLLSYRVFL